jgi:hypothetical protein
VAGEVEHQRPELGGLVGQPHEAEFLRYRKRTADGRHGCYLDRITNRLAHAAWCPAR